MCASQKKKCQGLIPMGIICHFDIQVFCDFFYLFFTLNYNHSMHTYTWCTDLIS